MKNLYVANVLIAAALLLPTYSFAKPPKTTCSFKVYNCKAYQACGASYDARWNVHVFNGSDSVKGWAIYEQASLRQGRYTSAKCNEGNCDTKIYNYLGQAASINKAEVFDYCGDIYIDLSCANNYATMYAKKTPSASCKADIDAGRFTEQKP